MLLKKLSFWSILIFIISSGLLSVTPMVEAGAELPDRNTPTPMRPSESGGGDDKDDGPVGAYIELQAQNASVGAWSVVQWQDTNGDWHTVEGWQGRLDNGYRRWWVHPKDFGTEPFRWVIFNSPGDVLLVANEPFRLPQFPNETVRVEVELR